MSCGIDAKRRIATSTGLSMWGRVGGKVATVVEKAVEQFVEDARAVLAVHGAKAESSLYSEFRTLVESVLVHLRPAADWQVVEQVNAEQFGVPDYRVNEGKELRGWIELKLVRKKRLDDLTGHDQTQFENAIGASSSDDGGLFSSATVYSGRRRSGSHKCEQRQQRGQYKPSQSTGSPHQRPLSRISNTRT